ncbi:MAG TPA: hypothetical protein DEO84_00785 [candidate division Zixibacteria bacterium]|nr:hypothetical protein [candidate division Zixibacteria bacterium]HBY99830.1 hypothetical protein [candidate division Zixibacteria bacterium]
MKFAICLVSALLLAFCAIAVAGGPGMMSYQGELRDASDNPVPDGSYNVIFSIYGQSSGGTALWAETTSVTVADGVFSKTLGSSHALTYLLFEDISTYLGIKVGTNSEMTPRTRLVSVPYAVQSNRADTASVSLSGPVGNGGWTDNGSTVSLTTATDRVLINSTATTGKLVVNSTGNAIVGECTAMMGASVYGKAYGGFGQGLRGYATGASGNGVFGIADSGATIGVYGLAKEISNGKGVYGLSEGAGDGVYGESQGTGGRGVVAYASGTGMGLVATSEQSIGVFATSNKPSDGMGIFGMASGSHPTGIKGYSSGSYATGVHGEAASRYGVGIYGQAVSQDGIGVLGQADSADCVGVKGSTSGLRGKGLCGISTGPSGFGIYGENSYNNSVAIKGVATNATAGTGVRGEGASYGMYAKATYSSGIGLYAEGGTSGKAAKFIGNVVLYGITSGEIVMELGEGLDYAEAFDISEGIDIAPGTVVAIDPENPGKLTSCKQAYDKRVAGIIAGAQGLASGVRLGTGKYDKDVALAGRVYCQVEALDQNIEPGDLLTTSATPGYAMKASDHEKAQGAILGKAMEPLAKGQKGMILVLVTLQ